MNTVDLSTAGWTLSGWRQNEWALDAVTGSITRGSPDIGPVPGRVPGSVRGALVAAGIVPDPLTAADSRASEFIENRHWFLRTRLASELPPGEVSLELGGLDGPGQVLLDGRVVAEVDNSHLSLVIPLGESAEVAGAELAIAFLTPPDCLGQTGRTDAIRSFKPRFYYGWDWVPRIVQFGVLRYARLTISTGPRLRSLTVRTTVQPGNSDVIVGWTPVETGHHTVRVTVSIAATTMLQADFPAKSGAGRVTVPAPKLWEVASRTASPTRYRVFVDLLDSAGARVDHMVRQVGFRRMEWLPNPGAPAEAEPWLAHLNGAPLFLQGVNWVPVRPDFADVGVAELRRRLETYRDLGVTILRVWGGATIEDDAFYDLCDDLGLLVWQELPLSSSGLNNTPPDDPDFVTELARIADQWVRRLCSHPSVVIWSGGNELTAGDEPPGTPLDFVHPALAAVLTAIRHVDPEVRVIPTSPSGPRFIADQAEFGLGVHHDVHGPWTHTGPVSNWEAYWTADDALIRSEVGIAGASPLDLLQRRGLADDPAGVAGWRHSSAWWVQDGLPEAAELPDWVEASQRRQADLLEIAAAASKARFPGCGGFIVWLGHDTFPCAVSLSLLDADGRPKPAALALARVFTADPADLRTGP